MGQTQNAGCPADMPVDTGRLDFGHGQTFFNISLSSQNGEPCANPANGSNCSDIGKSGFIYATNPDGELITQDELNTAVTYICDNGVIHQGSTVNPPPPSNPACSDGRDNDGDGLTDLADPGCSSSSDTDESDGTSQCQDGRDNDGDRKVDFNGGSAVTANYPTTSISSNGTETMIASNLVAGQKIFVSLTGTIRIDSGGSTVECATGAPSVWPIHVPAGRFYNAEGAQVGSTFMLPPLATSGIVIPAEATVLRGYYPDDYYRDNSGSCTVYNVYTANTFPADPGCSSASDNDESDECQDGRDNDGDGLTDLNDPGCSSASDNDESDEASRIMLSAECIFSNPDGTKTAYFSFNNSSGGDLSIPIGSSGTTQNQFVPAGIPTQQLTSFRAGAVIGAVGVTFNGDSIEWRVRPQGAALAVATASSSTPACKSIVPTPVCQGFLADGTLRVRFGYSNPNDFDVSLPVGASNTFSPGAPDRGQPTLFFKGTVASSVEIRLTSATEALSWILTGNTASNSALPACTGECDELPVSNIKTELNEVAIKLAKLTKTAAAALKEVAAADAEQARQSKGLSKKPNRATAQGAEGDLLDATRAAARADEQVKLANELLLEIPDVTVTCPNAPKTCKKVDRINTINGLQGLYAEARNAIKRIVARTNFRKVGKTVRNDPIVVKALALEVSGLEGLAKLPRFAEDCSK